MKKRPVPFMQIQSIFRILNGQLFHKSVAPDFCNNRRHRNYGSKSSPPIMVFWARKSFGAYRLPSNSISQLRGFAPSCFRHFRSAERMEKTMPRRSIIFTEENKTKKSNFFARRKFCSFLYHSSRACGVNFFESLTPLTNFQSKFFGTATAPTATGPASGPRPTSSIPMIYFALFTALLYPCYTSLMSSALEKDFVHLHPSTTALRAGYGAGTHSFSL